MPCAYQAHRYMTELCIEWLPPTNSRTTSCAGVQIKLLVEEGGADVWVRDRWGKTAYDEARRVGATAVAEYLKLIMDKCDT